jgi:hypothetical protein
MNNNTMIEVIAPSQAEVTRRTLLIAEATYEWWTGQEFPKQPLLATNTAATEKVQSSEFSNANGDGATIGEVDLAKSFIPTSCRLRLARTKGSPCDAPALFPAAFPASVEPSQRRRAAG